VSVLRRRRFLIAAGVLLVARRARAQTERVRRVAVMIPFAESDATAQQQVAAFREGLAGLGWIEGRNLALDTRWGGGDMDRVRAFAKELATLKPDAILTRTTPVTAVMRQETASIPIVFVVVSDPVGDKLVDSLARPGGNVTGFTNVEATVGSKWLELLREIVPRVSRVALMYGPKTAPGGGWYYRRQVEEAARAIQMKVTPAPVETAADIDRAFAMLAREKYGGLVVGPDVTTVAHHGRIVALAASQRLPAVYPWASAPEKGGLLSYGVEYVDLYRRAAGYVDRILRGAKPSELPIQQPAKFELVINLGAAKALGLTVPRRLLLRADRVID
jgi:putative tryptophan/tyrosine transport system substrate-binding protein